MTTITYRDGVSIGLVVFYAPAFIIAVLLFIRQEFSQSWRFLVLFTLARLMTGAFDLATINNHHNAISMYVGYGTLLSIGMSLFEAMTLGLLGQVNKSLNQRTKTGIKHIYILLTMLLVIIGLALGIAGGILSNESYGHSGVYNPHPLSKAGVAIYIVTYGLILIYLGIIAMKHRHAQPDEKHILLAVAISMPFIAVRLLYSAISIFGNMSNFNLFTGSVTILLCMALIEEAIVVIVYEGVGLTLGPPPKKPMDYYDKSFTDRLRHLDF